MSPEQLKYIHERIETIRQTVTEVYLDFRNERHGLSWEDKRTLINQGSVRLLRKATPYTPIDEAFDWKAVHEISDREKTLRQRTIARLHKDCRDALDQAYLGSAARAINTLRELETRWESLCGGSALSLTLNAVTKSLGTPPQKKEG